MTSFMKNGLHTYKGIDVSLFLEHFSKGDLSGWKASSARCEHVDSHYMCGHHSFNHHITPLDNVPWHNASTSPLGKNALNGDAMLWVLC